MWFGWQSQGLTHASHRLFSVLVAFGWFYRYDGKFPTIRKVGEAWARHCVLPSLMWTVIFSVRFFPPPLAQLTLWPLSSALWQGRHDWGIRKGVQAFLPWNLPNPWVALMALVGSKQLRTHCAKQNQSYYQKPEIGGVKCQGGWHKAVHDDPARCSLCGIWHPGLGMQPY